MKLPFCVACLAKEDLQHHHLVMRSEDGGDEEANLVTLCTACHYKLHQRRVNGTYNHNQRRLEGIAKAKATGVKFGHKPKLSDFQRKEALKRRAAGETLASIARSYAVDISMISRLGVNTEIPAGRSIKPAGALRVASPEGRAHLILGAKLQRCGPREKTHDHEHPAGRDRR